MAPHSEYIPQADDAFDDFQSNYVTNVTPNIGPWNILVGDPLYVDLLAKQAIWIPAFAAGKKSVNPNHPQIVTKQNARKAYEKSLRVFNKADIAFNPAVTDTNRATLRVTIADTVRTEDPVPAYAPLGSVEKIIHGLHQLRIVDPTHPDTKEMPNAWHVEVWASITAAVNSSPPAPPDASFYFVGNANKFNFDVHWASNFGVTAYYYLVYENTHGATGPKSPIFSAVIA